jgi:septum formation protein
VNASPSLILASNSPRRSQLLALGNWKFDVIVSDVNERKLSGEKPDQYVLRLAEAKARAVAHTARPEQIIIGSDTAVVDSAEILGKPKDNAEAVTMLTRLRGHSHQVYTGIAVLRVSEGKLVTDLCVTDVPMRSYSDEEIEAYTLSGDPLDKAGAYAIQHPGFRPVDKLSGCYASVMGLPMCHLMRSLRQLDVSPAADIPANCQTYLNYQCPVTREILRGG